MKTALIILGTILFAQMSVAADSEDELEIFRSAIEFQAAKESYREMDPELLNSGLAEQDINRIIEDLAKASAACTVDTMVKLAELKSIDVRLMIDDADLGSVDPEYFDTQEFDEIVKPCFYAAAENAGLTVR